MELGKAHREDESPDTRVLRRLLTLDVRALRPTERSTPRARLHAVAMWCAIDLAQLAAGETVEVPAGAVPIASVARLLALLPELRCWVLYGRLLDA